MQGEEGRRQLFVQSEKVITEGQVANRVLQAGQVEAQKVYNDNIRRGEEINQILATTENIFMAARQTQQAFEKKNLLSADTELKKQSAEYDNLTLPGGIIDSKNIYKKNNIFIKKKL